MWHGMCGEVFWVCLEQFSNKYGPPDPRDTWVRKHFAEAIALGTKSKLDEEGELPIPFSLRGAMHRSYNA